MKWYRLAPVELQWYGMMVATGRWDLSKTGLLQVFLMDREEDVIRVCTEWKNGNRCGLIYTDRLESGERKVFRRPCFADVSDEFANASTKMGTSVCRPYLDSTFSKMFQ